MTDDPRQILAEAGVECPIEVERMWLGEFRYVGADAAILALARLVAKYKWQRDVQYDRRPVDGPDGPRMTYLSRDEWEAELERRWAER